MSPDIPCHMCGAESGGRVLDYETKQGQMMEIATVCPECMTALVQLMHGQGPEYVGLEK